ncbi:MAG: ABC transporter substrate-binding protein [Acidobacteria bacterium]|nr:MAG: ABC transporter substrate-binding protein [Acidobacteriota bacterium]
MQGKSKTLRGMTWKHDRGLAPLLATAKHFCKEHSELTIEWEARSLQEFGEGTVQVLADNYDLVIIDHPYMGQVAQKQCFLPLDEHFTPVQLHELERDSVGASYRSYYFEGHQWALPVDAAAQVAGYRADLLEANGFTVPQTWEEVLSLAKFRRGFVSPALSPLDSLMCFFTVCANLGEPPFHGSEQVVGTEIGQQALERLRILSEHSFEGALAANPIAIWERMSSSDDIAYCPLAFGYSNYARLGYRSKLVSFAPIPSSGRGPVGATLGGAGVAVSASCRHLDLTLEYVSWITGKECQRTLYVESGGQPASNAAWLDAHANKLTNSYFAATLPVLQNAWLRPRFSGFEYFQIKALTIVGRFLGAQISSRETLNQLDELYRKALTNEESRRKRAAT